MSRNPGARWRDATTLILVGRGKLLRATDGTIVPFVIRFFSGKFPPTPPPVMHPDQVAAVARLETAGLLTGPARGQAGALELTEAGQREMVRLAVEAGLTAEIRAAFVHRVAA